MQIHGCPLGKFVAALALSFSLNHPVFGDAVVNEPSDSALRTAVATGGRITFSFDGALSRIRLFSAIVIDQDTTIDATGRNITIEGAGGVRLFEVKEGVRATLTSMSLVNARFQPPISAAGAPATNANGGAVFNRGTLALSDCVFSNNMALGGELTVVGGGIYGERGSGLGGAIYSEGGSVSATNCVFIRNRAEGLSAGSFRAGHAMGGAIAMNGSQLTLQNCRFSSNVARGGSGARGTFPGRGIGGAIFLTNQLSAEIFSSQFSSNTAQGGFAAYNYLGLAEAGAIWNGSSLRLVNSQFLSNSAMGNFQIASGGAIYNTGSIEASGVAIIANRAIGHHGGSDPVWTHGFDGRGGGIFNLGFCALTNSSFLLNLAEGGSLRTGSSTARPGSAFGGGIYHSNGQLFLDYCTFAQNSTFSPQERSGALAQGTDLYFTNGLANAHAAIFASITNGAVFGTITDQGYNMAADNSAAFTHSTSLNLADPTFGPAAATYVPLAFGSLAINSGDPANFPSTDQLGITRPKGSGPDRGAVEFNAIWFEGLRTSTPGTVSVWIINRNEAGYIIQQSNDLATWTEAARTNSTAGEIEFSLPASQAGGTATFWRVVSQ